MKVLYSISLALLVCVGYSQHSIGVGCGQHRLLREMLKSPERLKIHLAEQKILEEHEKKIAISNMYCIHHSDCIPRYT